MAKVKPLSPALVSKIAAGEVVERPASVVKELVENSLDAVATRVDVEVERGGLALVRVVDDGEGMDEEDALLALEEYATSKISSLNDLSSIQTLGFRGEALHAISSVSRFTLVTSTKDLATVVRVEGGILKGVSKRPRRRGTTVEVRDLFFNLRARRRFMRSPSTEMAHVLRTMREYGLAYPGVHFTLREGDRVILDVSSASLEERAAALWGVKLQDLLHGQLERGPMALEGLMTRPALARRDAKHLFFFANGRPVKDRLLVMALMETLRGRLVKGEYPMALLFLTLSPKEVDVNVHPAKREVKFRPLRDVLTLIRDWGASLLGGDHPPYSPFPPPSPPVFYPEGSLPREGGVREASLGLAPLPWRFLGEYSGVFLLLEMEGDLIMVDKHALHERMLYDAIRKEWDVEKGVRLLLVPLEVPMESEPPSHILDALEEMGFRLRLKGDGVCEIKGVPQWFQGDVGAFIGSMLEGGDLGRGEMVRRAATLACRGAVKAGDPLTPTQFEGLMDYLISKGLDLTCPHGRPVVVRLSRGEVDRLFKRRV